MQTNTATLTDWVFAPSWLSRFEAAWLSGHTLDYIEWMVQDGCIDLNEDGLIDKRSLWEFQETLQELLHWAD
jgi:hypothetical protein